MSISTILSIVSMKSPSTNLDENDSILASREFIHRLLGDDPEFIMFNYGRGSILGLSFLVPLSDVSVMRERLLRGQGPNGVYSYTGWVVDDFFGIEVSAFAFLGARVGFNLAEFADFVTGWFGVDLVPDGIENPTKTADEGGERQTDPRAGRDESASTSRTSHE